MFHFHTYIPTYVCMNVHTNFFRYTHYEYNTLQTEVVWFSTDFLLVNLIFCLFYRGSADFQGIAHHSMAS